MDMSFIHARPYGWPHDGLTSFEDVALLIIDMQRDFCEPDGYLASMGYDIALARKIIPNIVNLRALLVKAGALVVLTREGHRGDLSDLPELKSWRSRQRGPGIGASGPLGRLLVREEHGWQIISELSPLPGDVIVDKAAYSAFYDTDLNTILRARGIKRLIFTGLTTDVCVHSTLRDAVDRGFECLLVTDACAATEDGNHQAAIATISTEGGIFGATTETMNLEQGVRSICRS